MSDQGKRTLIKPYDEVQRQPTDPPTPRFTVGSLVTFINDYGVSFPHKVIESIVIKPSWLPHIDVAYHLKDSDSPWCPIDEKNLFLEYVRRGIGWDIFDTGQGVMQVQRDDEHKLLLTDADAITLARADGVICDGAGYVHTLDEIKARLLELAGFLDDENISQGELLELQGLIPYIEAGDVQLLEAAGVPEFPAVQHDSDSLFLECVRLSADRAAVAGWPDFRRAEFIRENE